MLSKWFCVCKKINISTHQPNRSNAHTQTCTHTQILSIYNRETRNEKNEIDMRYTLGLSTLLLKIKLKKRFSVSSDNRAAHSYKHIHN